jgi:hypothetical protein
MLKMTLVEKITQSLTEDYNNITFIKGNEEEMTFKANIDWTNEEVILTITRYENEDNEVHYTIKQYNVETQHDCGIIGYIYI